MTAHEVLPLHKLSTSDFNKSLYITNKQYVCKNINTALENISVIANDSRKPEKCKKLINIHRLHKLHNASYQLYIAKTVLHINVFEQCYLPLLA